MTNSFNNRVSIRIAAVFVFQLFTIFISAQSNRQVAPESFSFDGANVSNMVNPLTGDFTYQLPIMNVPGPEGGYDINLTYSAGIKMEQDASWIGLGWNYSPGAIVRTVNGTPDDLKVFETTSLTQNQGYANFPDYQIIDVWTIAHIPWTSGAQGGEGIDWNNFSIIFGYSNDVSYAHSVSSDLMTLGLAIQDGLNNSFNPYSKSVSNGDNGGNVGPITTKTVNNTQFSHSGGELSFSQSGGGQNTFFYDIGHYSTLYWEAYGNYSHYTGGGFYLGDGYELDANETWRQSYNRSMDIYTNQNSYNESTISTNNLSFPAYDEYTVNAKGLNGTLTPLTMRDASLLGAGETYDDTYNQYFVDLNNPADKFTAGANFASTNQNKVSFVFRGQHPSIRNTPGNFSISGNTVTSNPGSFIQNGGWCSSNNAIVGSKKVVPSLGLNGDIEKFTITNEEGMTYYFNYPVYQYEKVQIINDSKYPNAQNIKLNTQKYVYSWLLGAIAGPDYVDKGPVGFDVNDEGYWVKFNYGTWTEGFVYSTPYSLPNAKTINDENKTVNIKEVGLKELAYLNSIETRSHVAYFVKFMRDDGLGSNMELNQTITLNQAKKIRTNENFYAFTLEKVTNLNENFVPSNLSNYDCYYHDVHQVLDGNGQPVVPTDYEVTWYLYKSKNFYQGDEFVADAGSYTNFTIDNQGANDLRQKVLGLKKIILVKQGEVLGAGETPIDGTSEKVVVNINSSILNPKYGGNPIYDKDAYINPCEANGPNAVSSLIGMPKYSSTHNKYKGNQVIDLQDLSVSNIESAALQVIDFNYDYSLCGNTPNSLPLTSGSPTNKGKLTLLSVDVKDSNGNKLSPSNVFTYGLNPDFEQINVGTTLDPKMVKMQDDWGFKLNLNSNLHNVVNKDEAVKPSVSAWSLTQIENPTGGKIKINYESDSYIREAATTKSFNTQIFSFEANNIADSRHTMTIPIQTGFGNYPAFNIGSNYQIHLFAVKSISCPSCSNQNPVLTGKFISSTSAGGIMYAKFEIVVGWDDDDDFSQIYGNFVVDQNAVNFPFTSVTTIYESKSITAQYQSGLDLTNAFIIGNSYTITIYGTNISSWAGSMYSATVPFVINNATVQSVDNVNKKVVFLLNDYSIKFTNSITPDNYSFSTSEYEGREFFGGGLRVKDLITEDENAVQYKTTYEYSNGVTSFAPGNLWRKGIKYIAELPSPAVLYSKVIEKNVGSNGAINSSVEYEFETMNSNVEGQELAYGDQLYIENGQIQSSSYNNGTDHTNISTRVGVIHNNTGRIGRIRNKTTRNKEGIMLSTERYSYYPKEYALNGVAQESFHERKRKTVAVLPNYYTNLYLTYSSRIYYPSEVEKIERSVNNVTTYTRFGNQNYLNADVNNSGFDRYTHKPLIVESKKATGEIFRTKNIMAYSKYPEMGPSICTSTNRNMLTAVTQQLNCSVNELEQEKIIGGWVKTYTKTNDYREFNTATNLFQNTTKVGVYHLDNSYVWKSLLETDGTVSGFVDFDWTLGATNLKWKKTGSTELFNVYGKPLESTDINNKYSAIKLGYQNKYPIAEISNGKYKSFAYSGAEDLSSGNYFGGEVFGADKRYFNKSIAHTGNYSVRLLPGEYGFSYTGSVGGDLTFDYQKGQSIRASVWVHKMNKEGARLSYNLLNASLVSVGYGEVQYNSISSKQVGNFYLLTLDFVIPSGTTATTLSINAWYPSGAGTQPIYFDDFRVHPQEALMSSSVYDEKTGWLIATLDENNYATRFYYDSSGRKIRIDKETSQGWRRVSENVYHFGRQ